MNKLDKMIRFMCDIARDNSHGYSQINRWGPDYDCSSLIISAAKHAGLLPEDTGATYTGNMKSNFKRAGWAVISDISKRKRGDILLNVKNHAAVYLGNNRLVHASGVKGHPEQGDQSGGEICERSYYDYPWDCLLRWPGEEASEPEMNVKENQKRNLYRVTATNGLNIRTTPWGTKVGAYNYGDIVEVLRFDPVTGWALTPRGFVCSDYLGKV